MLQASEFKSLVPQLTDQEREIDAIIGYSMHDVAVLVREQGSGEPQLAAYVATGGASLNVRQEIIAICGQAGEPVFLTKGISGACPRV